MDLNRIPGNEGFRRINFLFQAAIEIFNRSPKIAQLYIKDMRLIAEKLVLRLDPSLKREFCKKCSYLLTHLPKQTQCLGSRLYATTVCPSCKYIKKIKIN
ncbi:RPP21 [Blepharisma stoltei]|uniref:Uncharacterized protein n=1 Tax=Blepharisma stoltei TaxID=1481888 RepID=A0AAU9IRY1_9CILI|nr:unnamed protein product [Blepharisma stoltei]